MSAAASSAGKILEPEMDVIPFAIEAQRSRVATEGWGVAFQNLTTGFRVTKSGVDAD